MSHAVRLGGDGIQITLFFFNTQFHASSNFDRFCFHAHARYITSAPRPFSAAAPRRFPTSACRRTRFLFDTRGGRLVRRKLIFRITPRGQRPRRVPPTRLYVQNDNGTHGTWHVRTHVLYLDVMSVRKLFVVLLFFFKYSDPRQSPTPTSRHGRDRAPVAVANVTPLYDVLGADFNGEVRDDKKKKFVRRVIRRTRVENVNSVGRRLRDGRKSVRLISGRLKEDSREDGKARTRRKTELPVAVWRAICEQRFSLCTRRRRRLGLLYGRFDLRLGGKCVGICSVAPRRIFSRLVIVCL